MLDGPLDLSLSHILPYAGKVVLHIWWKTGVTGVLSATVRKLWRSPLPARRYFPVGDTGHTVPDAKASMEMAGRANANNEDSKILSKWPRRSTPISASTCVCASRRASVMKVPCRWGVLGLISYGLLLFLFNPVLHVFGR
jgi:hypothetical protein